MTSRTWMWISWPAFLVAGLLEMVIFAMVDPQDVRWFGAMAPPARASIYTLAFFVFWVLCMVSGALTLLLAKPSADINRNGRP